MALPRLLGAIPCVILKCEINEESFDQCVELLTQHL